MVPPPANEPDERWARVGTPDMNPRDVDSSSWQRAEAHHADHTAAASSRAAPPDEMPRPSPARPPREPWLIRHLSTHRPGRDRHAYGVAARTAWIVLVAGALLTGMLWATLDVDGDGAPTHAEWGTGASAFHRDSDGDGLPDGWELESGLPPGDPDWDGDSLSDGWEARFGYDPADADPDGDGLPDHLERDAGSDPFDPDTDGDGIDDGQEQVRLADCDEDGIFSVTDADDDDDGRLDGDEQPAARCDPDVDGDGVPDGDEGHDDCVFAVDCDQDGLGDADERRFGYDPLDPDTFDTKLADGVVRLFEQAGQQPSADADGDGIPDAWEGSEGLIDWGPFDPTPGVRDLLLEFLRVEGPDSSRYGFLDFRDNYARVASFFDTNSQVRMQWVETRVTLDRETRPPIIPSSDSDHYADLLLRGAHTDNPFVSTMVMNPQHNQSGILHLGVAPIRGMLAAVDYGAHTSVEWRLPDNRTIDLTPLWESVIAADRQDIIQASGFQSGGTNDLGQVFLVGDGFTLQWHPAWFASPPRIVWHDGSDPVVLARHAVTVNEASLDHTILHELGHNLGLCHTELVDCHANLSAADQTRAHLSTMYTPGDDDALFFLPSEWAQIDEYLACPPRPPLGAVASGEPKQAVIQSKYGYQLEEILDVQVRACGDFTPTVQAFAPVQAPPPHTPQGADHTVPQVRDSRAEAVLFWLLASLATPTVAYGSALWRLRRR